MAAHSNQPYVAGVDSSTQAVKVVVRDKETGELIRQARAPHPEGTEIDPREWWAAFLTITPGLLDGVGAISVAGQQHGMVALDSKRKVIRPALLWNDTRSASAATDLVRDLGGAHLWAKAVGSVPLAAFTVSKLRWLAEHEPENARRTHTVILPHDYLTWQISGTPAVFVTDRGDASGTGYWSAATEQYRPDLITLALGHDIDVPRVAGPSEQVGRAVGLGRDDIVVGPGTGDNMAAALALDIKAGDVVISLGTSGTAFSGSLFPTADPSGHVAGFADATGKFLPLVCTLNAARILGATAAMLNVNLEEFTRLALSAEPGSGGITFIPYLDGERTPNLPNASGSLWGLTRENMTPENISRSAIEGMLGGLGDAVEALAESGALVTRVKLIGGAAANPAVAAVARTMFNVPLEVPSPGEYVADGAARQAAWVISESGLPTWEKNSKASSAHYDPDYHPDIRGNFAQRRKALYG